MFENIYGLTDGPTPARLVYYKLTMSLRADNSGVGGGIWPKFELIQAFMHVLTPCKNEDDRIKKEGARVFTRLLPL